VHFEQTFAVGRPPEDVFAFMVEPDNLAKWQTVKTYVTPLTEGLPRLGYRVREGTKVGFREWDQVVEFTEFEPGRAFGVRVIEGPASRARWTFQPAGSGTRVHLEADMKAPRVLGTLFKWIVARQFRGYHENLRHELERP
jgi:carbon monoxide dehydrogenase subunit G